MFLGVLVELGLILTAGLIIQFVVTHYWNNRK